MNRSTLLEGARQECWGGGCSCKWDGQGGPQGGGVNSKEVREEAFSIKGKSIYTTLTAKRKMHQDFACCV